MTHRFLFITLLAAFLVAVAAAQEAPTHTVQAGETLYRIATTNGMTVDELKRINGLTSNTIHVGQILRLTSSAGEAAESPTARGVPRAATDSVRADVLAEYSGREAVTTYTVKDGETLYSIAADRGTKAYILFTLNDGLRAPLEPGRPILIPDAPRSDGPPVYAVGQISVFPETYVGRVMAGGNAYDPAEFVVAHRELPFDTVLLIENGETGRASFGRVADRGPLDERRLMEVSAALAEEIGIESGARVRVRLVE